MGNAPVSVYTCALLSASTVALGVSVHRRVACVTKTRAGEEAVHCVRCPKHLAGHFCSLSCYIQKNALIIYIIYSKCVWVTWRYQSVFFSWREWVQADHSQRLQSKSHRRDIFGEVRLIMYFRLKTLTKTLLKTLTFVYCEWVRRFNMCHLFHTFIYFPLHYTVQQRRCAFVTIKVHKRENMRIKE